MYKVPNYGFIDLQNSDKTNPNYCIHINIFDLATKQREVETLLSNNMLKSVRGDFVNDYIKRNKFLKKFYSHFDIVDENTALIYLNYKKKDIARKIGRHLEQSKMLAYRVSHKLENGEVEDLNMISKVDVIGVGIKTS